MSIASRWLLDHSITFLNHGSFGACPIEVLEEQRSLRERMEREPVLFFGRELEGLLDEARGVLARFVGADADDVAFVPNASSGVSTVLRSLRLEPGDELIRTNHGYQACNNALTFVAERAGATVTTVPVPFPLTDPEEVTRAILAAVGPRTRLVLVDHVTSPTGVIFPVEAIVRELKARGVETLVDGAHAPGMLELDIKKVGAAYYTGNCHKWLCAPKGAAFLHVRRDLQTQVHPLTLSHGMSLPRTDRSRFRLEFDWTGTDDPTAMLCLPAAIRFLEQVVPGGLAEVRKRNHALALEGRAILCQALGASPPAPDSMIGSLAAVALPDGPNVPLAAALFERHAIEVPIVAWPEAGKRLVRISAQVYNDADQVRKLARSLVSELS